VIISTDAGGSVIGLFPTKIYPSVLRTGL